MQKTWYLYITGRRNPFLINQSDRDAIIGALGVARHVILRDGSVIMTNSIVSIENKPRPENAGVRYQRWGMPPSADKGNEIEESFTECELTEEEKEKDREKRIEFCEEMRQKYLEK